MSVIKESATFIIPLQHFYIEYMVCVEILYHGYYHVSEPQIGFFSLWKNLENVQKQKCDSKK